MKMKNILNSLFPWLAMTTLLSLQGCENEEGTAIHSRDTVSFEIDAGGARATETTFETGDAIGVYAAVRMSSAPATLKRPETMRTTSGSSGTARSSWRTGTPTK